MLILAFLGSPRITSPMMGKYPVTVGCQSLCHGGCPCGRQNGGEQIHSVMGPEHKNGLDFLLGPLRQRVSIATLARTRLYGLGELADGGLSSVGPRLLTLVRLDHHPFRNRTPRRYPLG
jgi:hypothetical protein